MKMKTHRWKVLGPLSIMLHSGSQAVLQQLEENQVQMGGQAGERLQAPMNL